MDKNMEITSLNIHGVSKILVRTVKGESLTNFSQIFFYSVVFIMENRINNGASYLTLNIEINLFSLVPA